MRWDLKLRMSIFGKAGNLKGEQCKMVSRPRKNWNNKG